MSIALDSERELEMMMRTREEGIQEEANWKDTKIPYNYANQQ